MEDETTRRGNELILIMKLVLKLFEKAFDKITALIGDSKSTNQSIATKLNSPLLGWASHALYSAARHKATTAHWFARQAGQQYETNFCVCNARTTRRTLPTRRNGEHWLVGRAAALSSDKCRPDLAATKFEELNKKVFELQNSFCTLGQTQTYFKSVLEVYPTFFARLHSSAKWYPK